ncbi:MAG: pyridoxamine 5'-phosphate oxidase family protein [Actinobacteria bacterium]|nr:pyridoxamine 5'-phosphate oxidase family protein [Actinomycetota bacterium]MCL6104403.1 pyridoxamine 5'-phosphate oxidase family protein [Actinomycetota bacterium]
MSEKLNKNVLEVLKEFRCCEFSTVSRSGTPVTWPTVTLYQPDRSSQSKEQKDQFTVTTSISWPQKAFNIRRSPNVSLFFSDPTAAGLYNPPFVLVEGSAKVDDAIQSDTVGLEQYWKLLYKRQPVSKLWSTLPFQPFMDWYYMRLVIHVSPSKITWWQGKDFEHRLSYDWSLGQEITTGPPVFFTSSHQQTGEYEQTGAIRSKVLKKLSSFSTAVLSIMNRDGFPISVRCLLRVDRYTERLELSLPDGFTPPSTHAWLLCHSFNRKLWRADSFGMMGILEPLKSESYSFESNNFYFYPTTFVQGVGSKQPISAFSSLIKSKSAASKYLAKRSLVRPKVAWDELIALKKS